MVLSLYKSERKIRIVPNAIDEKLFELRIGDKERIQEIRALYNGKPIVFFMGRHTKYKGLPHLIEAEQYMKSDCVIVIGGKGPLTKGLKALAKKRNSARIHLLVGCLRMICVVICMRPVCLLFLLSQRMKHLV